MGLKARFHPNQNHNILYPRALPTGTVVRTAADLVATSLRSLLEFGQHGLVYLDADAKAVGANQCVHGLLCI